MAIKRSILIAAGICLLLAGLASAQTTNYSQATQTSGMFGTRSLGGDTNLGGSRNLSGTSGGTGGGAGGTSSMVGAGTVGQTAMPFQAMQRTGFVGQDRTDSVNVRSQAGNQANRGNLAGAFQNLFSQDFNAEQGNQKQKSPLRLQLRIGFQSPPISTGQFTAKISNRLAKLPGLSTIGPITVQMEGQTAVLQGRVGTEADRQLAAELAMLEPEVLDVRNDLLVGPPEPSGEELPPPPPAR